MRDLWVLPSIRLLLLGLFCHLIGLPANSALSQVTPLRKAGFAPGGPARPDSPPQPAILPPSPQPTGPTEKVHRQLLVNDLKGHPVVARIHGREEGKTLVILPDGQLGFPDRLIETRVPFVPATFDAVEADLSNGEFSGFKVLRKSHYLIFTKATDAFTAASGRLLEDLYDELFTKLEKSGFAVHPPEFPLVAVIFRTEREFRAHRAVDKDIQAYYEIFTNRIYLYEQADRESTAPEVAAMRKPQTVAHEGAHQILHNIGVQPRLAPWPIWLVEGLAEYCSPPTIKKGQTNWAGLGMVNAQHLATIRDIAGGANVSNNVLARQPDLPMVQSLVCAPQLTPTDYALAWGLTHYLATRKNSDFLKYLKSLGRLEPGQLVSPEQHLADFEAAFGRDLFGIDRQIVKHINKLKVKPGEFLPYYAVMVEQVGGRGQVRRVGIVSQSPSSIREWLTKTGEGTIPSQWNLVPHTTKGNAQTMIEAFVQGR